MLPALTFVLGGAASGKSQVAEKVLLSSGLRPVYLATARIWDKEMQSKVDLHRARRDITWTTVNAPTRIDPPLRAATADQAVLLDCATMWLSNVMLDDLDLDQAQADLLAALEACAAPVVVVSNEVGQGIVPDNALSRRFREAQGRLNIALAAQADTVLHVVAGLPQVLKGHMP
ncbi:MAG: bifunctional adenosylcobinamide kinase/adenosylcobinamide-phosphate guanylyltransferase [Pseudomonadota bacterium]